MSREVEQLVQILTVEAIEKNLYRGKNQDSEHVFGGQVLAQAVGAAYRTVNREHHLHSLHGYFLRPGDWESPILYQVDRIRDGRSFTTRRVVASQHGDAIFELASSWQVREPGLTHAEPIPDVPPPESLRSDREIYAELANSFPRPNFKSLMHRFETIDSRSVEKILSGGENRYAPVKHTWLRVRDQLSDDPSIHLALLAYMSDMDFMATALLPHGQQIARGNIQSASLDHAIWIHQPFRADEWLLFAKNSPNARSSRGFVRGQFFSRDGKLIATAAQECLIRIRNDQRKASGVA